MDKNREELLEFSIPQSADEAEDITDTEFEVLLDSIASTNKELLFESSFPTDAEYEILLDLIYPIEHHPLEDFIYPIEVLLPETFEPVIPVEVPTQEKKEVAAKSIIEKPMTVEKVEKIETDATPIRFDKKIHSSEQAIKEVLNTTSSLEVADSIETPTIKVEPVTVPLAALSLPTSPYVPPAKSSRKPVREKRAVPNYTIRDVL